jgi:uncharacterized protein
MSPPVGSSHGLLGFSFNEQFSAASAASLVIEENTFAMLMTHERFAEFVVGDIADARQTTEVLLALSAESREGVDTLADAALSNGGGEWQPAQDHGFMYGRSLTDPDGHVWEVVWMDPSAIG